MADLPSYTTLSSDDLSEVVYARLELLVAIAVSFVFIAARFFTRIKIVRKVTSSDYVALLALVLGIINALMVGYSISSIVNQDTDDAKLRQYVKGVKFAFITELLSSGATCLARISVALLLIDIVHHQPRRRRFLHFVIVFQLVSFAVTEVLLFSKCRPIQKLWNSATPGSCAGGNLQLVTVYVQGALDSFTDLILLLTPLYVISRLNMKRGMKITLMAILGLGGLAGMIASLLKTLKTKEFQLGKDITYALAVRGRWGSRELNDSLITATVPTLKPLVTVAWRLACQTVRRLSAFRRARNSRHGNVVASGLENIAGIHAGHHHSPARTVAFAARTTDDEARENHALSELQPHNIHMTYEFGVEVEQALEAVSPTRAKPRPTVTFSDEV